MSSIGDERTQPGGLVLASGGQTTPGATLLAGRYHVVDWLGAGGMGTVYRARDVLLGEQVALKVLRAELAADPGALERFRREVKLARRVSHRHVARMFDLGSDGAQQFLVMELVDGESLAAILRRGPLPVARVVDVAIALCAGLGAAHEAGVVHRDLKPENVMIAADGRAVITDFGVARAALAEASGDTERGVAVGTPWYMAPEQLAAADVDHRADLWALGVILYEMLTGVRPFGGESLGAVAVAQTRGPAYELASLRPETPATLAAIIDRLLERERERRFGNAADVARALGGGAVTGATRSDRATGAGRATTTLAVLPLRGAPEDAYLADGVLDDLIDVLSMTRGLRVRSRGAVQALGALPPEEAGLRLDVRFVIDASLRRRPGGLRLAARLISVADGVQVHATRTDCTEAEILDASERLARDIAAALATRVERVEPRPTDPRAVELYLRARGELRRFWRAHVERAVELLDEARPLAADAPALLSARAFAQVRRWLISEGAALGDVAHAAALEAIAAAPQHGEARVALGMARINRGEVEAGVADLAWALSRAPLMPAAHEQAGRILVEVGATDEGLARLRTAARLDPEHAAGVEAEIARVHALAGRWDEVARTLAPWLDADDPPVRLLAQVLGARLAMWRGGGGAQAWADEAARASGNMVVRIFGDVLRDRVLADADWAWLLGLVANPGAALRGRLFVGQVATELALYAGDPTRALAALETTAALGLFDTVWIERCPLLAAIADEPRLAAARAAVAERAAAVLAAYRAGEPA